MIGDRVQTSEASPLGAGWSQAEPPSHADRESPRSLWGAEVVFQDLAK